MTALTERYLAVVLRGIPQQKRADVERELRSSIADAVEDRLAAGGPRDEAETAALEDLGDPARLSAELGGRSLYLIGPGLFLHYRRLLVMLLGIIVPIVAVVAAAVELSSGGRIGSALVEGGGAAFMVAIQTAFWVTLVFALIERVESPREVAQVREELGIRSGRWTVGQLPDQPSERIGLGETLGEVVTLLITGGGLILAGRASWEFGTGGQEIPLLDPAISSFWIPILVAVVVLLIVLRIAIHRAGRWTMPLAVGHGMLEVAFAGPLIYLALTGMLINTEFADAVGWPPLAEADGPVMVWVAAGVLLVTAWEIFDGFRKARRPRAATGELDLGRTG